MAQDIVGGLFGIQQQPDYYTQDQRAAIDIANLNDPRAMGRYYGAMIGAPLGRAVGQGIGSLLGVEDPRLKQQKVIASAKQQGFDVTTAEGLQQLASYFVQQGEPGLASQVAQQAQGMTAAASKMQLEQAKAYAEVKKADAEKLSPIARMLVEGGYDLNSPEAQAIMRQAASAEITGKVTPKTVVNVSQQQESEFSKELGKIQGKQMEKAYNTRDAAVATLGTLTKMSELNDQQLISGSFAGGRVGAANLLNTLGLASEADAKRLSNSQQFNKVAGDLVLANIKQLGYNPSNADVKFLNETLPSLESNPAARRALINWMATKAQGSISEVRNMESYALKNRSLNGYVPTIPNFNPTGGTTSANMPKPLSEMTTEELKALRAKQQK